MAPWGPKRFRDVEKDLARAGYRAVRQKGSHVVFKNQDGRAVTVPDHGGSGLARGTMRSIAKQAGIDPDQLYGDPKRGGDRQREPIDLLRDGNPAPGGRGNAAGDAGRATRGQPRSRGQGRQRGD